MEIKKIKIRLILSLAVPVFFIAAACFLGKAVDRNLVPLGFLSLPFFFLAYHWHVRLKEAGLRLHLRNARGSVDPRKRDMDEIDLHFRLTQDDRRDWAVLNDQTWSDLDLETPSPVSHGILLYGCPQLTPNRRLYALHSYW